MRRKPIKKNEGFYIYDWMVTVLGLRGNDKEVFALIHSFTCSSGGYFAHIPYMAQRIGASVQGIEKNLKTLIRKGFISKEKKIENGKTKIVYKSCILIEDKEEFRVFILKDGLPVKELRPGSQGEDGLSEIIIDEDYLESELPF